MRKFSNALLLFCLILGCMVGCREQGSDIVENHSNDFEILLKLGYDTTGIVDLGTSYLLEGDMVVKKSSLKNTKERQVIISSAHVVSVSKRGNLKIRIDASVPSDGGNFDWRNEISQAIQEYNVISGSSIYMTLVGPSDPADITISALSFAPSTTMARANTPPGNGDPGGAVQINTSYSTLPISSGQKKYALAHELGHTIGFLHTNDGTGAVVVGGSPNSGSNPDPSSVFNGGTAGTSWSGFSYWDTYSISFLYPPLPIKLTASSHVHNFIPNSSGMTNLSVSGSIVAKPGRQINLRTYIRHNSTYANYYMINCFISGALFNDSTNGISRSGSSSYIEYNDTKWFIMPSSGIITWSGQYQINESSSSSVGFIEAF